MGRFPLSTTLDLIGPLARTVADCAKADAVMAGADFVPLAPVAVAGLRFGIAQGVPLDRLDHTVAAAFAAAIERLEDAGVRLRHETVALFDEWAAVNAKGGIAPPEACAIHRDRIARRGADIDPNVRVRIERGGVINAADYIDMLRERRASGAGDGCTAVGSRRAHHADDRRSSPRPSPKWPTRRSSARAMPRCCAIPRSPISSISAPSRCRSPARRCRSG